MNISSLEIHKLLYLILLFVAGCSSITPINDTFVIEKNGCRVTVYQTKDAALAVGPITERCVIEGTSAMSFVHTPETAIKKHAPKACKCGADNVYILSRSPIGLDVATASMVAFTFDR